MYSKLSRKDFAFICYLESQKKVWSLSRKANMLPCIVTACYVLLQTVTGQLWSVTKNCTLKALNK